MRSLLTFFTLLLTTHATGVLAHSNNDVVTMYNGDRITGEIKGLVNGDLKINPAYAAVIALELEDIASIDSNYNYEILTENNERLYGNISSTEKKGALQFTSIDSEQIIPLLEITELRPIEESFAERLQYTLGANFNFEPDLQTYKIEGTVTYASKRGQTSARANVLRSNYQSKNENGDYVDDYAQTSGLFRLENERWSNYGDNWYRSFSGQYDYNDELNNFGRVSLGSGIGRYFIDSAGMRFSALVGLQGIRERSLSCTGDVQLLGEGCFDDTPPIKDTDFSAEGFLTGSLVMYSLTNVDLDINITGSVYPSLTDDDRLRAHLEAAVKWEAVGDLNIKLSLNSDYDSGKENADNPLDKTLDYSILLGLEWAP
ncbi:MAG: DUF481 domain-containing protein [Luminiphilus sp.]|nr:DUF481 domain-containing protein [Luminiphilus sp.]